MKTGHSLTQGSVGKVLLRFSLPFFLANLLQALYEAVDLLVVGLYCPAESVAAVSTGTQVTQIITSLLSGLTLGGTVLVAKYTGLGDTQRVERAIGTTLTAFGVFSLVLSVVLGASVPGILQLLQTPAASVEEAWQYVFICCMGTFFLCEYNALSAVLRGYGDSLTPLLFVAVACVCNVVGDLVLVGVFHLGPAGTAFATVFSQGVSMVCAVVYLNSRNFLFRFSWKNLRVDRRLLKELVVLGVPVSLQECMVRVSFLYLTSITNSFGVYAASAVGIASKYDVFAMLPATSVSSALTALTAQNLAAGREERAGKFLRWGTAAAFACSLVFFAWAQLAPQTMIGLFSQDPQVIARGVPFFRSCSWDYLAVSFLFCYNGYLNGRERTLFTMANSCSGALLIRVPLLLLLSHGGVRSLALYGLVSPFSSLVMLLVIWVYLVPLHRLRPRAQGRNLSPTNG